MLQWMFLHATCKRYFCFNFVHYQPHTSHKHVSNQTHHSLILPNLVITIFMNNHWKWTALEVSTIIYTKFVYLYDEVIITNINWNWQQLPSINVTLYYYLVPWQYSTYMCTKSQYTHVTCTSNKNWTCTADDSKIQAHCTLEREKLAGVSAKHEVVWIHCIVCHCHGKCVELFLVLTTVAVVVDW